MLDFLEKDPDLYRDEDKRPYVPASTISAGLNWRFLERFHLSLDAQRVSDMYVTAQARRKGPAGTVRSDGYFGSGISLTIAGFDLKPLCG